MQTSPLRAVSILAFIVLAFGVAALLGANIFTAERFCSWRGGRWASVLGTCVTRACYVRKDCGHWANPMARCGFLHKGDPLSEAYFQLGEPDAIDGDRYVWHAWKESDLQFTAVFKNGRLDSLPCMARLGTPRPRAILEQEPGP